MSPKFLDFRLQFGFMLTLQFIKQTYFFVFKNSDGFLFDFRYVYRRICRVQHLQRNAQGLREDLALHPGF